MSFVQPWLLAALLVLPLLWLLMRVLPPPHQRIRFPGVRLLFGLETDERRPSGAPIWLRLLRLLAVALAIVGLAGPLLDARPGIPERVPLAIMVDGGWASAADWEARRTVIRDLLTQAERADAPVAMAVLAQTPPADLRFEPRPAASWRPLVDALEPMPWAPDRLAWQNWVAGASTVGAAVYWLHDTLDHGDGAELGRLLANSAVTVIQPNGEMHALGAAARAADGIRIEVGRSHALTDEEVNVAARNQQARTLATATARLQPGQVRTEAEFSLPGTLANRIAAFRIPDEPSAVAVRLLDDSWRRPRVGISTSGEGGPEQPLLQGSHYVDVALAAEAEMVEAETVDLVSSLVDVLVLVDRGELAGTERAALVEWVEQGGLLIRFAGPRMASWNESGAGASDDPLLPVRLSPGGRNLGGAFSWDRPQGFRPFHSTSPFAGMTLTEEVRVERQLLAAPDASLAERAWARLEDGTPIVTGVRQGEGEVVLFHTTATPDWTSLPLTGAFVEMLRRVARRAGNRTPADGTADGPWSLEQAINHRGELVDPPVGFAPIPSSRLSTGVPGPDMPPGIYVADTQRRIVSIPALATFERGRPELPTHAVVRNLGVAGEVALGPWLLVAALVIVLLDGTVIALLSRRGLRAATVTATVLVAMLAAGELRAQESPEAAFETTFGYIVTGDAALDRLSQAGLFGLGETLRTRTSVEPAPPVPVNLETDDLSLYSLLYWPIGRTQPTPSAGAVETLNRFLFTGGLLVLDTRDQGPSATSRQTLARLAGGLDLPPLALAGPEHVLTRSFYLLNNFPGRWDGSRIWVAQDRDASSGEVNDGVSPVIVGGADWAAAWAMDELGQPMAALGPNGEQRREMALRAGVNFVMYALTGNYKSDQVHLPAILERLGH